ncbi:MAG: hypothetical protein PHR84_00610 [Candidatus Omnitrophica bacterium]|jgi:hypothetical protein|nr:hypothetical protein [Candidatus Omnitrophota bacterium]MDD5660770.1 hypothetical protein [Candidatus Omnitrophota bacterium]
MKKRCAALLLIILFFAASLTAQVTQEKTVSGIVVDIDWVSSTLTVRFYPDFSINADEINLKVTSDSIMRKGTHSISLSDILQSDPVTVTYYDDGTSGLKIKRLADLNLAGS